MPNGEDRERINHRLDQLEGIIRGEWTVADIERVPARDSLNPSRIRVEIDNQQATGRDRVAIIFATDLPLMSDTDIPYERIFDLGIQQAHRVFNEVPNEERILQGTVVMTSREVTFELYTGQE
ncbi:MAG TPA: hypothetical protein VMW81_10015 [Nitrospinota bacterium]|nr:hypothetical protein [Nitrospinota bacterium]